ncbi:MAG TPA: TIGR03118 family protein [Telluria sp.]|nr:TIGR03118 family protein [Telluria sp.]
MNARHHHRVARLACMLSLIGCFSAAPVHADSHRYQQRNLVADTAGAKAENVDPHLVNPWGIAFNPFGVVWVSDNHTGLSTLYDGDGHPQSLVVTIPPAIAGRTGSPTGIVFNGSASFVVTVGKLSGPGRFLFASEDGVISAWAPAVDATNAIRVFPITINSDAVYKGLAIGADGTRALLYATDFHNNRVDVFDSSFTRVTLAGKPFVDPNLPQGYAPFGIQAIGGDLYVTYARQDSARMDDVPGSGFGFVSVFAPSGQFVRRIASHGALNAPWGLALAPASFGRFSNRLLVGNFGDGAINAYDLATGKFTGRLRGADHKPILIEGLWGLAFGNGVQNQPVDTLFFTAGPGDEEHGLYGRLDVIPGDDRVEAEELQ